MPAEGPDVPAAPPGRRRHRRATGGVPPTGARVVGPDPLGTSADDTDVGWGDRPPGPDDDRILQEKPPHW